ncbi:CBP80/20-dependent translation initiation factor [Discoglossus pictus]
MYLYGRLPAALHFIFSSAAPVLWPELLSGSIRPSQLNAESSSSRRTGAAEEKDFSVREELHRSDVERWLGFITFLCEVFGTMRSSTGEPFRVLVCPIYTCLRELLQSQDVKEDAVLCCSMELQSTGRLLEEQLPEMMTELLATARDKMLCPSESMLTREKTKG